MHVTSRQASSRTFWKLVRAALLACLFSQVLPASAQTLPDIGILTEQDDDSLRVCQVSHESAAAAARSALRYNRISVASLSESDWYLYINLNALPIERGGQDTGSCAVSISIEVKGNQILNSTPLKKSYFGSVIYCKRGGLTIWDTATAQTTINSSIKGFVDECVAEIEDDIR